MINSNNEVSNFQSRRLVIRNFTRPVYISPGSSQKLEWMSAVSLPVTRPIGRALIVASPSSRSQPAASLQRLGYTCVEVDDPYSAMLELCRRPLVYRAIILSLTSLYKEELAVVQTVKQRFPHIEVWLTQTDGRQASLAESMRLGADGLLSDDGLHRIAITAAADSSALSPIAVVHSNEPEEEMDSDMGIGEPVLTADELRALLQEQPTVERDN
jgi:DNA-binding NarL/FixJ family response regulator